MRTLIIDDSEVNAQVLSAYLDPFGECRCATSGQAGLEMFEKAIDDAAPYGLICLDIMMPEMDGHAVLSQIRDLEKRRRIDSVDQVKIIMTTVAPPKGNLMKAFSGQCDGFLSKPISKDMLYKELYLQKVVDADTLVKILLNINEEALV